MTQFDMSRIKKPNYNAEDIMQQLNVFSKKYKCSWKNLFILAETEQIPLSDCDKVLELFSIYDTLNVIVIPR